MAEAPSPVVGGDGYGGISVAGGIVDVVKG